MQRKTVKTVWDVHTYDVWGNSRYGYDVNDKFSNGTVEIAARVTVNNAGTPREFESAYPSDYQLGKVFGTRAALDVDGDDTTIYVNRARDGYPLGELHCTSHESLSPIRAAVDGD